MNVQMNVIPLRGAVLAGRGSNLPLLVKILPPASERVLERPPLNLALVLDRSGSMSGAKLALAKEAACNLVSNLTSRDRVSIVAFDEVVTCMAPSAPVTDHHALHRAINSIHTAGQTALHQGWVEAGLQVGQHLNSETLSRVILLTDGQANVGERRPEVLASNAKGLAERGISTTTMGIGDDYDEKLLEGMASGGDGNFYHIQSAAQFEQFFGLELMGLANLVGGQVRLEMTPRTGVSVRVLNRLERQAQERGSSGSVLAKLLGRHKSEAREILVLPNMIAKVPVEVSLILELEKVPLSGLMDMLDLRLTWSDPKQASHELKDSLALPVVSSPDLAKHPENAEVAERIVLMEVASLKLEANEMIGAREFDAAAKCLKKARALVLESPQTAEMKAELADLDYIQKFLDQGQYASVSKHAYYQSHQRSHSKSGYSSGRDTRD
jgi:Ca-activated chloride channel family protein